MTEPARWMDLPAEAPHGAVELLAHVEPPPVLDPTTRAEVARGIARLAEPPAAPSRWAWMAAAAVLLFSLGVATTLVLTGDGGGDAVAPAPATGPATSMQPVEPAEPEPRPPEEERAAGPPAPEPPGEETPEPERRVAAPTPPDRRPPTRTHLPSSPSRPPVAQPRGEHAEGTLSVNTMPWSRVFIDGRDVGNTPQVRLRLPAGRHEIVLAPRGDVDATVRRTVEIRAGETTRLVLRL